MTQPDGRSSSALSRRQYLAAFGAAGAVSAAGCLGDALGGDAAVALDEPSDELDSDHLPYPTHGESFPDFELPDPIAGETISTDSETLADQTLVVTGFYAFCPAECLLLIGSMAETQRVVVNDGYADDVTFLPITFDPERDTPEELDDYADEMNVDRDAGNWRFLRPEDEAEARAVVDEKLAINYEQDDGAGDTYEFIHNTLTYLVNPDRYVERVYRDDDLPVETLADEAMTVADAY